MRILDKNQDGAISALELLGFYAKEQLEDIGELAKTCDRELMYAMIEEEIRSFIS